MLLLAPVVYRPLRLRVPLALAAMLAIPFLFGAPAYEVYGKMIVEGRWETSGATAVIGLKDADLALEAAATAGVPLPSTHVWRDYLAKSIERGEGHLDWAVMAKEQARASGLEK